MAILLAATTAHAADPFIDELVSFRPGAGAGFGQDLLPAVIQGPPRGGSLIQGGLDVLSLGHGGEIVVRFTDVVACDGPGPDFTIFENAFHAGSPSGPIFAEVGIVAVSADGESFTSFPFDAESLAGLAGTAPVLSSPDNGIDPTDPSVSGGNSFDLADLGIARVEYIRITDGGDAIADPGNRVPPGTSGGFDLDAIAVVNSCGDATPTAVPSALTPTASPTLTATATPPPIPTSTATATATATPLTGDLNDDGLVDHRDHDHLIAEIFDDDGDRVEDVHLGSVRSSPDVDLNGDGRVTAADLAGVQR